MNNPIVTFDDIFKLQKSCRLCLTDEQEISLFEARQSNQPEFYRIVEKLTNIVVSC